MKYVFENYNRFNVSFKYGRECYLYDINQVAYLDFASGIAVSSLGHHHPAVIKALQEQSDKLWHVSNLYCIPEQEYLAQLLCKHSFADKVFFCNSGLEANEVALKLARRYFSIKQQKHKYRYLAIDGAFHGRSFALMGASTTDKIIDGFTPLPDWFDIATADNFSKIIAAVDKTTAAIILEPLQGEGGINLFSTDFLKKLRTLCNQYNILLIMDEIQCGNGRTGKLWCHEHSNITPDIMTTAKGLGAGFPIGAVLAKQEIAMALDLGSHGSTFGGNPLACSVATAVLQQLTEPNFLTHVVNMGKHMWSMMQRLADTYPDIISGVLGKGLMCGLQCNENISATVVVKSAFDNKLLLVPANRNVVRLLPPLIVQEKHIAQAEQKLFSALDHISNSVVT